MYKVFVNERPLFLASHEEIKIADDFSLYMKHSSVQTLLYSVELLEKENGPENICISHPDLSQLWNDFLSLFEFIESAGGVVKNQKGDILLINRYTKWDLPKGKVESGETPEEAAIREVTEECGLTELKIIRPLESTFHTFLISGNRKLKKTYWFEMTSSSEKPLVPQSEEGIIEVRWAHADFVKEAMNNTYNSIKDILSSVLQNPTH